MATRDASGGESFRGRRVLLEITESDGTIAKVQVTFRGRDRILMEELEEEAEGQVGAE